MNRVLLFSDVDDTFRDREGHFALGRQSLRRYLRRVRVILASSRSVEDLQEIQSAAGMDGPLVAENGAVVAFPADAVAVEAPLPSATRWRIECLGLTTAQLRPALDHACRTVGVPVDIQDAPERRCSVLFRARADDIDPVLAVLRAQGLSVTSGGDWLTLTGGADKGTGARAVMAKLGAPSAVWLVAGIGDGENDGPLLRAVERPYVIRRPDGSWHPELAAAPGAFLLAKPGLAGWRFALRALAGEVARI